MGTFTGANINKLNGGLGRSTSNDRVMVLICGATATAQLVAKTVYPIYDITTAESLGITAATDANNAELVHYHLSEMTRLCPGFTFYLIPVAKTTTIAALTADADIKAAIRGIAGVNVIGIAGIASATVDVINTDVLALQAWVNAFATEKLLIDGVFLEGIAKAANADAFNLLVDLFDLRTLAASNVSVVVGHDPVQAALNAAYAKHAAVGTVLGSVAVRKVHEDLGSVDIENKPSARKGEESFSLADTTLNKWLTAALSDGTPFRSLTGTQATALSEKGYIFIGKFENYDGWYLSGCPTAVVDSSDYAFFNFNCIWNKAARIIRTTLIPLVRSKVPKEADGTIKTTWISSAEEKVKNAITAAMLNAGNADGFDIYINPAQNVNASTPMAIKAQVQVGDVVHEFDVDLGLTSKI
ncbi:MAG: DUF2586 family protein [Paludibacter sp.]|nr:DUF2586 family protein [Paludibacter sp.]